MPDNVNHPSHYQSDEGIEVIDVIAAFTKKLSGVDAFDIGCAIKHILRFTEKNGIEDLKKAIWYINDYVERNKGTDLDVDAISKGIMKELERKAGKNIVYTPDFKEDSNE